MNAALTIMQAVDWKKYSLEEWCRQFGAWMNGDTEKKTMVYKTMPCKKISQTQREKLLALYMSDDNLKGHLRTRKSGTVCEITDNEARAFQRIIIDLREIDSEVLQHWLDVVWEVYVENVKLRKAAEQFGTSTIQIRQDMKCGLAFINGRYPNFKADLLNVKIITKS